MLMHRRTFLAAAAVPALLPSPTRAASGTIETRDGQRLFTIDKGTGRPVVFIHGWTLSSAIWSLQVEALASQGLRAIAYDRRGHGQSSKPETGYDYEILSADLATLLDKLDLKDVVLVGHSMGAGEVVRYLARHGRARVSRVMLVAPTTPYALRTDDNPQGVDRALYDKIVAALWSNRYGYLASGAPGLLGRNAEPELVEWAMSIALQATPQAQIGCLRAFSETDFRPDLAAVKVPTLIVYGTADSPITPINAGRTQAGIAGSRVEIYEGAPHALFVTDAERFNRDLLQFARS
ncbi:alpha/beta fold hydrolase [Reyranella sp.]|uniref:alpha/beta fold hydrolase n=1 Tax=Reyranella sp. TaxID=1929291 RepID=UPI003D0AC478